MRRKLFRALSMDEQTWRTTFYNVLLKEVENSRGRLSRELPANIVLREMVGAIQRTYATLSQEDVGKSCFCPSSSPSEKLNVAGAELLNTFGQLLRRYLLAANLFFKEKDPQPLESLLKETCLTICKDMRKLHEQILRGCL